MHNVISVARQQHVDESLLWNVKQSHRHHHSVHLHVNPCKWHLVLLLSIIISYWSPCRSHTSQGFSAQIFFSHFFFHLFIHSLWVLPGPDENLKGRWHWSFKATLQHQSRFEHIEIFIVFILSAEGCAAYWYPGRILGGEGARGWEGTVWGGPCESVPVLCRSTKRDKAMLLKQSKRNATVLSRGSEKEVRGFLRMGRGEMKELSLVAEDTRAPYMQSTDRLTRQ